MVLNRLRWQWRQFPFGAEEALCVFKTALTFVDSVPEIWGPLLQGRALLVLDKQVTADTERLVHALEDNGVSQVLFHEDMMRPGAGSRAPRRKLGSRSKVRVAEEMRARTCSFLLPAAHSLPRRLFDGSGARNNATPTRKLCGVRALRLARYSAAGTPSLANWYGGG